MTNEKNKINELVERNDERRAELQAATLPRKRPAQGDAKTIGRLQYDIEQLRARWLGLTAEISVREEVADKLNADIDALRESLSRKDDLLEARDAKIGALEAEIRDLRDGRQAANAGPGDGNRLARSEAYADALRRKLQDVLAEQEDLQGKYDEISAALEDAVEKNRRYEDRLADVADGKQHLERKLENAAEQHAEEIRVLRFELGEAQETVAQSEVLSTRLASDLSDTREFRDELERMLSDNDEKSRKRIARLEKELARTTRDASDLEERLEARSDAINVLLAELARKSRQIESISEIGDAISDIDVRISEQFEEEDVEVSMHDPAERITRVLVGKVGGQLLRFPLFKDRLTIGRTADNDIQLTANYISRRHAVVQADGNATRVIDWGSKNGVFVNSARVSERFLKNGDIVSIGNARFRYEERPKRDL